MSKPTIRKSTRHSKITGNFAEGLILYWLSKHGFECAQVDHTGIDLIARNPYTKELMGISVKGRSRTPGTESSYIGVRNDDLDKVDNACMAFGCVPYFAFLSDGKYRIDVYIVSKPLLLKTHPKGQTIVQWKMTNKHIEQYRTSKEIISFQFKYETLNWWSKNGRQN